jgi:lysyl-tRNA synthetase class 2
MNADQSGNEYREQRLANMKRLGELGYEAYGRAFARTGTLSQIRAEFEEKREVSAAGRLMTVRNMGKSIFADLRDGTDRYQIYVQKNAVGDEQFEAFQYLDLGDFVGVTGELFMTRTGEQTIKVGAWTLLAKSLLPLPEKWHGLKDVDARYRQRYLDLVSNQDSRETFNQRVSAIAVIRSFLESKGFVEVETPMMQPQAGGAAAKPFATHYAALGQEMYLRVAPELYLKRLLVGGFDKVFELNRCFRNEGLDRTHNPEFTMLEAYEAYSDVEGVRALVQDMITEVARRVFGKLEFPWQGSTISLEPPWRNATYAELIAECMGPDWDSLPMKEARSRAESRGLSVDPAWDRLLLNHEVYEKLVEGSLMQPTFVRRLPSALIPLARACEDDASLADVFELVIGGQEIAPGYTELNDPLAQRERLAHQVGHDPEKMDQDFLCALEHGMPPAGGLGVGVDRLLMLLSGREAIRDVILFPQLKPKSV